MRQHDDGHGCCRRTEGARQAIGALREFFWALPILAAFLLILGWHVRNAGWPTDDAANYMATAYQEYLAFKLEGFWSGLGSLIALRGWRPIFFPPLAVPFLGISSGNIVTAMGLTLLTGYLGFVLYVFAITRRFLSRPYAVAATVSVTTLPPFATYALVFFSEIWWLFFSVAWLYHIIASRALQDSRHASLAGLFLGFAFMIRPAETAAIAALPVIYFLAKSIIESSLGSRERVPVALAIGGVAAIACLLVTSAFVPWLDQSKLLIGGGVLIASIVIVSWRWSHSLSGASCFCGITAFSNLIWWAGFMPALYSWVHATSFGEMAAVLDSHKREGVLAIWAQILSHYNGVQIIVLVMLGVAVYGALIAKDRATPKPTQKKSRFIGSINQLGIASAGMLIPILVLYAVSGTTDPRRLIVSLAVVVLFLTIVALLPSRFLHARAAVVWLVACINIVGLVAAQAHIALPAEFEEIFDLHLPRAHWDKDSDPQVIGQLQSFNISPQRKVAVYTLALFQASARVYEPAALQLAALKAGYPDSVGYLWDEGEYQRVLDRLFAEGYRYVLLDLYDGPGGRAAHNPYVTFTENLLDKVENGMTLLPRLRRVETFKIGGRDQVLFEILSVDH